MWRFSYIDRDKHHATEAQLLELVERLVPGDKLEVEKEIGTGFHVTVQEAEPPRPIREFEG